MCQASPESTVLDLIVASRCGSLAVQDVAVPMTFRNRVTEMLGIEHPVLLAPMDVVSGGRLAAAR